MLQAVKLLLYIFNKKSASMNSFMSFVCKGRLCGLCFFPKKQHQLHFYVYCAVAHLLVNFNLYAVITSHYNFGLFHEAFL